MLVKLFDSDLYMKITTPKYLLERHQDIVLVDTIWDGGASINKPAQNKVESAQSVRSGGNDTTCNIPTVNSEGAKDVIESNTKSHGDTSNTSISNDYDHEKETTTDNSVSKAGGETKDTVSSKSPSIATDLDLDKMNKKQRENRTLRG